MTPAKDYAEALFRQAEDPLEVWRELAQMTEVIAHTPLLKQVLMDASVQPAAERTKVINSTFKAFAPLIRNLLGILVEHSEVSSLPAASQAYRQLLRTSGVSEVVIETAQPLSARSQKALVSKLKLTGRVIVTENVRPDLLGGVRVIVNDVEHDFSLAGALENIRQQLAT